MRVVYFLALLLVGAAATQAADPMEALERLEALDRSLAPLELLDREVEMQGFSPEVLTLIPRGLLKYSALGSRLAKAREANNWEDEVAILTEWAAHIELRKQRAAKSR